MQIVAGKHMQKQQVATRLKCGFKLIEINFTKRPSLLQLNAMRRFQPQNEMLESCLTKQVGSGRSFAFII